MCVYTHFVFQVFFLEHYFYQTKKSIYLKKKKNFGLLWEFGRWNGDKVLEEVRFNGENQEWC